MPASPLSHIAASLHSAPKPGARPQPPQLPYPRHSVALCCDFFYPRLGGVESHVWSLAQCLLALGLRVIVVTSTYTGARSTRVGVRYMVGGLVVYHLPLHDVYDQATLPTYYAQAGILRRIFVSERVRVVHGHAVTSPLAHEAVLVGGALGLGTVFTDHSLFGFTDAAALHINKYASFTLAGVDATISVSRTGRENLLLRAPALSPHAAWAIPNAVDAARFTPPAGGRAPPTPTGDLVVVMLCRLVYRKGIDLAAGVIPLACAAHPRLKFVVGGDGPKRLLLEEMVERHGLHGRVELLGAVRHNDVADVLRRGHIFLNTSLTEAFCIALLEAASVGCLVVSTRVGGVPEVLPPSAMLLAEPTVPDLTAALSAAVARVATVDPLLLHSTVAQAYSWPDVAARTSLVYDAVAGGARPLSDRLMRYAGLGGVFGPIAVTIVAILHAWLAVLAWFEPAGSIAEEPDVAAGWWWRTHPAEEGGPSSRRSRVRNPSAHPASTTPPAGDA